MKFLFTLNSFRKGGLEKATIETARALKNAGHSVFFVIFNPIYDHSQDFSDGVVCVGSEHRFLIQHAIRKFNTRVGFDIIIHTRLSIRTDWFANTHYIVHTVLSERLPKSRIRAFLKINRIRRWLKSQHVICVSNGVRDDLLGLGISASTMSVIYNIYDPRDIHSLSSETSYSGDYIVSVGSFNAVKRHDVLLRAYQASGIDGKLVFVGDGGTEKANILGLVENMELIDRVVFAGFRDNPYPYIKNARLLVVSSDSESFSSVCLEAFVLGTPVVSTACKGPAEILGERFRDFLTPCGDAEALAASIIKALKEYPEIDLHYFNKFLAQENLKKYEALCDCWSRLSG